VSKTVIFYRTGEGKCPVKDFLDSLPGKVAQKTPQREIERAEAYRRDYLQRRLRK
jgi:hypothetical protein